jgi:hypothetical protein
MDRLSASAADAASVFVAESGTITVRGRRRPAPSRPRSARDPECFRSSD